jgi:PPOX class probable F420-dependent enzyme
MMAVTLDREVRAFLEEPLAAVLATVSPSGRPQATPVWFLVEDGHILVNTSRGRVKLRNMRANPHVVLTVVDPRNMYRWVQIRGQVVRFDPARGARDIDRLSQRYRGQPYQYPPTDRPENRVSVLIEPRSVSGGLR